MNAHPEMNNHDRGRRQRRQATNERRSDHDSPAAESREDAVVPEIYEVVIECRHEEEQRAVFERMCGEGFRCRVMTL